MKDLKASRCFIVSVAIMPTVTRLRLDFKAAVRILAILPFTTLNSHFLTLLCISASHVEKKNGVLRIGKRLCNLEGGSRDMIGGARLRWVEFHYIALEPAVYVTHARCDGSIMGL